MGIFFVLSSATRRQMLDMLLIRERSAGEFVRAFPDFTQSRISQELQILRKAGLVDVRYEAPFRIYVLRPEGLKEIDDWLAPYRGLWIKTNSTQHSEKHPPNRPIRRRR
jgi:DNA-binding transcriptional ArsR family regulator